MLDHDPTLLQSWLIAIPTILTAVSTWYLRRGSKKSHAETERRTTERLDSYNGAIADKIEELEAAIEALKKAVEDSQIKQVSQAQKYTETMNSLELELAKARATLQKCIVPAQATQAGAPADKATPPKFGEVKIIEASQTPVGKVKWEKGD